MAPIIRRDRLWLLCMLPVLALLLVAAPAEAHAVLLETSPASDSVLDEQPERVVATFSEPVEPAFGALRVYDTNGDRVDDGDVRRLDGDGSQVAVGLEPDLPEGTYTATYRVVSADSHPIDGAFVFHVGEPGERPEGIAALVLGDSDRTGAELLYGGFRWLNFAALLLLAGTGVFYALLWNSRKPTPADRSPEVERAAAGGFRRLLSIGFWGAVLGTAGSYVLQTAIAGDVGVFEALSPSNLAELASTRYGTVSLIRVGLLALLAIFWFLSLSEATAPARVAAGSSVGAASAQPVLSPSALLVGGLLLLVLLATPGLGGHPGATEPVALNVLADVIHVAGAAVWIGGLVALLVIAFGATRELADEDRTRTLAPVVGRFSDVATVAIAAIVVSGVYRSWVEVQALRGLTETSYGRVLLIKVIAFLPILALGAINNLVVKPRMLASDTAATSRLKRFVTIEVAIGAVVVALTALLVNIAPARTDLGIEGPFIRDVAVGEDKLNVIVDPNEAGENIVHLTLMDADGLPQKVRNMRVSFTLPVEEIGPLRPKARKLGPGHYAVQGRELSIAGEWRFEVEIMYDRFTLETVSFQVPVNR